MKPIASPPAVHRHRLHGIALVVAITLLFFGTMPASAQQPAASVAPPPPTSAAPPTPVAPPAEAPKIPSDQLDSLVAPIALYPDPLLSQTLVASTYPLEVIQLQQWLTKNKNLKGKALTDAVMKETWDPSIQAMAAFPDVVKQLAENVKWTDDLGNAFLAQQADVMDAVQRMRTKADGNGALKTSKEQKVQKTTVENKSVIVIEPADPETVYVPSYNPTTVYGPSSYYPYPPMYYPPYAGGALLGFGAGIIVGGAINGGWGYGCGWGNGDVNINNNNNFVNNSNRQNINNRQNVSGGNKWQHNPQHRGGAPYSNKNVSNKYGGDRNRGPDSNRPGGDRNQGPGGDRNRPSTNPSTADRNRPSTNKPSTNRPSTADRSNANRPSTTNRPSSSTTNRPSGGSDRVGNQNVMKTPSSRSSSSAFNSGGGYNRSSAAASSSRGASSMSRGSGGGSRGSGGGSRGGGRRR